MYYTVCICMEKKNEKAKANSFVARSSSAQAKKSSKILVREVEQIYVTEVQGENSGTFNYYTECVSDKNIRIENEKLKRFVARSSRGPPCTVQT